MRRPSAASAAGTTSPTERTNEIGSGRDRVYLPVLLEHVTFMETILGLVVLSSGVTEAWRIGLRCVPVVLAIMLRTCTGLPHKCRSA